MEFVTIHDLSRELNVPARVIRYRLIQLIADQKLKEHEDFRRDEYKDDQHFIWKIHPTRFMQETSLKPAATPIVTDSLTAVNRTDNQPPPVVNKPVTEIPPPVNQQPPPVANVDTKAEERSLAREMIDILKDQIHVKDQQLREQGEQLKDEHELNLKLTGTMLQQAQEIKTLLRLTGGRTEIPEVVTKDEAAGNRIVNDPESAGNNVDNQSGATRHQNGNDREVRQAS